MSSTRKVFLLLAVVAILAGGVFAASAQDDSTPVQQPFGRMGHGMMMGGYGMWGDDTPPMLTSAAEALGIDPQTLVSELQSGKTLAQLAEAQGVDLSAVTAAAQTTMQQHLSALVAAGALTQAQADARLTLMLEHWANMPMFTGAGFGMMTGMRHGGMWNDDMPHGRMGRGG